MAVEPEDDERVTRQVVYSATTSSRQNIGIIIAIVILALLLLGFIIMQVRQKPPHRRSELTAPVTPVIASVQRAASIG